jgi:dGTPase
VRYEEAKTLFENIITKSKSKLGKLDQLASRQEKIGFLRALAIGDLMDECATLFLDSEPEILAGKFNHALADLCPSKDALKAIISLSVEQIYRARQVVEIEAAGHQVLPGLLEEFLTTGIHTLENKKSRKHDNLALLLPEDIRLNIRQTTDHYTMARYVVDFVSGLTDRYAISLYKKIKGFAV